MNSLKIVKHVHLILLLIISNLFAKDVYISFSFSVKNYKLINKKFTCTAALTNSNHKKKFLFSLPCKSSFIKCCKKNKEKIIDNLLKLNIFTYSKDKISQNSANSYIKLTFPPKRFDIIIKDGVMKIYLKEE